MSNCYCPFVAYYKCPWTHLFGERPAWTHHLGERPVASFPYKGILSDVLALGRYHFAATSISVLANGCYQLAGYLLSCRSKWVLSIFRSYAALY